MQAMPMINQPAPINDVVAPRAARSVGKSTDDKFLPALQEASGEYGDDELAGAAMVAEGESSQQPVLVESSEAVQGQPMLAKQDVLVATEEMIDAPTVVDDQALSAVEGEELVLAAVKGEAEIDEVEDVDAQLLTAVVGKEKPAEPKNDQPLRSERQAPAAQAVQASRQQQQGLDQDAVVEADAVRRVTSAVTQASESQKGGGAQVVAAVSEGNSSQQLNIQPLKKVSETSVAVEKMATDVATEGRPVVTDPRFASLLNKPEVGATLRQQQGLDSSSAAPIVPAFNATAGEAVANTASVAIGEEVALAPAVESSIGSDLLAGPTVTGSPADSTMSTTVQPQVVAGEVATTQTSEVTIPLKDGSNLPESRVVQQTIDHLTLHARGDSSSVTVRLHPEELGELQLRMVMEGDQLKVHLQAQTQQVQEVLERNFPRLREALQDQGVTVEDFQVSVDSGERGDQQSSEQREFVDNSQSDHFSSYDQDSDPEVEAVISAAAAQADGRGVSLRV